MAGWRWSRVRRGVSCSAMVSGCAGYLLQVIHIIFFCPMVLAVKMERRSNVSTTHVR